MMTLLQMRAKFIWILLCTLTYIDQLANADSQRARVAAYMRFTGINTIIYKNVRFCASLISVTVEYSVRNVTTKRYRLMTL